MAAARTVVEDHQVSRLIDAEAAQYPRLRDVFDGLTWLLARHPEVGHRVRPDLWVIRSYDWPAIAGQVVLAYSFDENQVRLRQARVDYPQAGRGRALSAS